MCANTCEIFIQNSMYDCINIPGYKRTSKYIYITSYTLNPSATLANPTMRVLVGLRRRQGRDALELMGSSKQPWPWGRNTNREREAWGSAGWKPREPWPWLLSS